MLLLNSNFSLLGNTQTFIAAIATLCVLCFFRNGLNYNSNFIELLIKYFNDKFLASLQKNIAQLTANYRDMSFLRDWGVYHKSADEEDRQKLLEIQLEAEMVQYKLYNDSERNNWIKTRFESIQMPFKQKQSQGIMAYFTFILCILALSFDVFVSDVLFAGWFLFFFDFILCTVFISTWTEYVIVKPITVLDSISNKKSTTVISAAIDILLFIVFFRTQSYVILVVTVLLSTFLYYNRIISHAPTNDYDFVTITKDIFVFVTTAIFISLLFCISERYGFIYTNVPSKLKPLIDVYNSNVLAVPAQIAKWRSAFAILCVLNAILVPIFLTYVMGQTSLTKIKNEYEDKLKEIEIIERRYKTLKEAINQKITPNIQGVS